MAILNKIRQKTVVLILVIALALFAFILSSLFDNRDALFSKSQNVVATINGKDISRESFMAKVEARQRQSRGQSSSQVMNAVYENEVREVIMDEQFKALGLTVEPEQMRDLLKANLASSPQFQNDEGVFDQAKLNEYILSLKETSAEAYQQWIDYESSVANSALQQDYFNLVKAGTTATIAEGKLEHELEGDKINIKFVQVPYASIIDSTIAVSKSEIQTYINNNKKEYEVEASRSLSYVKFDEKPSLDDENALKADLIKLVRGYTEYNNGKTDTIAGFANLNVNKAEAYVNTNSDLKFIDKYVYASTINASVKDSIVKLNVGDVYGPYKEGGDYKITKLLEKRQLADSISSSHIIVPFAGTQRSDVLRTKEEAKKMVDSLFKLVKNNKAKFSEVANEINTDGSKGKDGSIGWTRLTNYNPAAFDPDFANFLFFNKKGAIDVVLTKFGYHIIRIDDKKNVDTAYKLATISRKVEASDATTDKVFRDASNFQIATENKDFEAVAKEGNYALRPVNNIKILGENIPGLGEQRPIVRWAFDSKSKIGDVKRFNVSGGYAIVQITAINEAGLMNTEDASVTALPEIRKEKKAKLIKEGVSATTLNDFAKAKGQTVRSASAINMKNPTLAGAGLEPLVIGTAFGLEEGKTSGLITGEKGVFMVEVTGKTPAVELDNYQSSANQVSQAKLSAVNTRLFNALKEAAQIEDNRANTVQ